MLNSEREKMDQEIIIELRKFIKKVAAKTSRQQFEQEPHFTAAFFGNLNGEKFQSSSGEFLALTCSSSNDRGPNSAESKTGVDIGIVIEWQNNQGEKVFEKAVLLQAKNRLASLKPVDGKELQAQCEMMRKLTTSYGVMDCPYDGTIPQIGLSDIAPPFWKFPLVKLDDYLIETVFVCKDGDTNDDVISQAKRADRSLTIRTNSPKPAPKPKLKR
jgi:hypothetical protein